MRFADPPTLDSPRRGYSGDELDGLLQGFFQSEMPHPWPKMSFPEEEAHVPTQAPARPAKKPWPLLRSRFALAASVALLLIIPALLSDSFGVIRSEKEHSKSNRGEPTATRITPSGIITDENITVGPDGKARVNVKVRENTKEQLKKQFPD